MPDIRYVCMSDLHFGAQNSLLTNLSGIDADPMSPSPTLTDLVDCLEALTGCNEDGSAKPVLILNGDAVDFALSSDEVAVMAFEQFVRLAFAERDLFSHTLHYLPGNHDHHMWETAHETQYAAYISRRAAGEKLAPPWHSTPMFPSLDEATRRARTVEAEMLQTVIRRFPGLGDVHVEVHYPSFGILSGSGRAAVFNHGHYIDSIYRLMSRLKADLFPASLPAQTPWGLESENFAWIDFFWSTLGRSGDWGADVTILYDMLQDGRAVEVLANNLATGALAGPKLRKIPSFLRRWLASKVAEEAGGRIAALERHAPGIGPLSTAGQLGLATYLEGPLLRQFEIERPEGIPEHISFVFGHTHKPYEAQQPFAGYPRPLDVYNTGGWVVDSLQSDVAQGGAVVVFDDELNSASLQLFNQGSASPSAAVRVRAVGGSGGNSLAQWLEQSIDPNSEPWAGFSGRIGPTLVGRRRDLTAMIARGTAAAQARPAPGGPPQPRDRS